MHIYSFNNLKFTLKHDRLQHSRLLACVIAQEYSPSTSVELPFFFPERRYSVRLTETLFFSFSLFLKILFRNSVTYSCVNPGNVCSHYLYRCTLHSVIHLINTPINAHMFIQLSKIHIET